MRRRIIAPSLSLVPFLSEAQEIHFVCQLVGG